MFIQDFYLGLDGKQRIVVLGAIGSLGAFICCCALWLVSGLMKTAPTDKENVAITSGTVDAELNQMTAAAASLAAPTKKQIDIVRAGLAQPAKRSPASMQSIARSQESMQAYRQAKNDEVKAALLPGFARRQDYDAMPLIVEAITSDSIILSGRALAAAQHLLGVRYENSISQLKDPSFRKQIADMVLEDWQHLQKYPKFKENIGS